MERSVAIKKLTKLLGKKFGYRINKNAPTPEERAEARLALGPAIEERNALTAQRKARYEAILAGDAEYQRLVALAKAACEKVDLISYTTRHFKITVGTSESIFFSVKAEGDSWEEVIAKLTPKKPEPKPEPMPLSDEERRLAKEFLGGVNQQMQKHLR